MDYLGEQVYKVFAWTLNPDFRSFYDTTDKNPPPVDHPDTYKPTAVGEVGYMEESAAFAARDAGEVLIAVEHTPLEIEQLLSSPPPFLGYDFDGTVIDTNAWTVYIHNLGQEVTQNDAMFHTGVPGSAHSGGGIIEEIVRSTGDGVLTIQCEVEFTSTKYGGLEGPAIGASATNTAFDQTYYSMPFEGLFLVFGALGSTGFEDIQFYTGGGTFNLVSIGSSVASGVVIGQTYSVEITFDFDLMVATAAIDGNPIALTTPIPAYVKTQFDVAGYRFTTHISQYNTNTQFVLDRLLLRHTVG